MKHVSNQKGFAVIEAALGVLLVVVVGAVFLNNTSISAKSTPQVKKPVPAKIATTTTLTSSNNPALSGETPTLTATVTNAANVRMIGQVGFTITSSTGSLVNFNCVGHTNTVGLTSTPPQTAKCAVPQGTLTADGSPYTVRADFVNDGKYASSSATLSQTISPASPQ